MAIKNAKIIASLEGLQPEFIIDYLIQSQVVDPAPKKQYKKLFLQTHPDKNDNSKLYENAFKAINEARAVHEKTQKAPKITKSMLEKALEKAVFEDNPLTLETLIQLKPELVDRKMLQNLGKKAAQVNKPNCQKFLTDRQVIEELFMQVTNHAKSKEAVQKIMTAVTKYSKGLGTPLDKAQEKAMQEYLKKNIGELKEKSNSLTGIFSFIKNLVRKVFGKESVQFSAMRTHMSSAFNQIKTLREEVNKIQAPLKPAEKAQTVSEGEFADKVRKSEVQAAKRRQGKA